MVAVAAPGTRRRRRSKLTRTGALPFLVPGIVYVLLMFGYPIYDVVRMAFSKVDFADFTTGAWKWVGLQNFRELPNLPGWSEMLRNTGIFLVGSIIPQFLIGGLLAVVLRESSRVRRIARSLVLLPWLFPAVATATVFLWMFQSPEGLFDSLFKVLGLASSPPYFLDTPNDALVVIILVNIWIGIPFNYLVIQSGLQAISRDLHESAVIDGASWLQELLRVTVPLLRETLITVLMIGIMGTMNVFAFVWILTQGGPANATMLPGLFAYQQAFTNFNYGGGAAVIVLIVGVLLVVAVAYVLLTGQTRRGRRPAPAPRSARTTTRPASPRAEAGEAVSPSHQPARTASP
jgi:multiple sugar transport system permease protein